MRYLLVTMFRNVLYSFLQKLKLSPNVGHGPYQGVNLPFIGAIALTNKTYNKKQNTKSIQFSLNVCIVVLFYVFRDVLCVCMGHFVIAPLNFTIFFFAIHFLWTTFQFVFQYEYARTIQKNIWVLDKNEPVPA